MTPPSSPHLRPPTGRRLPTAVRVYRRLLACYPGRHRSRFGTEMERLFHDQWIAASSARSGARSACWRLLGRTALDFLRTCPAEHCHELRRLPTMMTPSTRPRLWGLALGLTTWVLVLATTLLLTARLPRIYQSTTRVLVRQTTENPPRSATRAGSGLDPFRLQTELELLRSDKALARVVERLDLNRRWSREHLGTGTLQTPETTAILADHLEVRQFRNTDMFEIRVYDRNPGQAAEIANGVAEAYRETRGRLRDTDHLEAVIVDSAEPGLRPIRPNVPLNVFVALLVGLPLGVFAGVAWWWHLRRSPPIVSTRPA